MKAAKTIIVLAPGTPAGTKTLVSQLPERGLPEDARMVYSGRNTLVAVRLIDGSEINIKRFHLPHLINRCAYGWWRGSKARRAFHNALALTRLGINTPKPMGYIEERSRGGLVGTCYYICEQLPEGFVELRGVQNRPDFEQLVDALAAFVADMHRKGVYMKDLSPGNVLVSTSVDPETSEPKFTFALVDVNRMEFDFSDIDTLVRSCGTILDTEEAVELFAERYSEIFGVDGGHAEDLIVGRYQKVNRPTLSRRIKAFFRSRREL